MNLEPYDSEPLGLGWNQCRITAALTVTLLLVAIAGACWLLAQ
jgi:hypothetical protein